MGVGRGPGLPSSDDEFEKEMESEVQEALEQLAAPHLPALGLVGGPRGPGRSRLMKPDKKQPTAQNREEGSKSEEFYDEVYFDSSSSSENEGPGEGGGGGGGEKEKGRASGGRKGRKVRKLTNDELFYDPDMDDADERWINRQRLAHHNGWAMA